MTTQADYYRALTALSNSVNGIFFNSPGLLATIGSDPAALLISAFKLRHRTLFRECFILSLGPWSKPRYKQLRDWAPDLYRMADAAYAKIAGDYNTLYSQLLQLAANHPESGPAYTDSLATARLVYSSVELATVRINRETLWYRSCCE